MPTYHARKTIRDTVVSGLEEAGVLAGRIFTSRSLAIGSGKIPAIVVWTSDENAERAAGEDYQQRVLTVQVIALASRVDDLEAIAFEVESRMPNILDPYAQDVPPPETSFSEQDDEQSDRQYIGMSMEWSVTYHTDGGDVSKVAGRL